MQTSDVKARIIQLRKQRAAAQGVVEASIEAERVLEDSMKGEPQFKNLFQRIDGLHAKMDELLRETKPK